MTTGASEGTKDGCTAATAPSFSILDTRSGPTTCGVDWMTEEERVVWGEGQTSCYPQAVTSREILYETLLQSHGTMAHGSDYIP